MDLEFVCTYPPDVVRYATCFLLAYPFLVWLLWAFRPSGSGPMSASVVPAALTPLFVGSAMASTMMASALRARSFGISSTIVASNAAEGMIGIGVGSMFAAFVSLLAWAGEHFSRATHDPMEPTSTPRARSLSISLVITLGLTIIANVAFVRVIVAEDTRFPATLPIGTAVISLAGAIVSLAWLIASRRLVWMQFNPTRRTIAAACAVASFALLLMVWGIIKAFA